MCECVVKVCECVCVVSIVCMCVCVVSIVCMCVCACVSVCGEYSVHV